MRTWSRREVLQGVGALVVVLAGAGVAGARTGGQPTITVYKDPT